MPLSSRFTIALHMLSVMDAFKAQKITSQLMADSIGVNPVVIRRLLGNLKAAEIVSVKRGSGGASIAKSPEMITYFDIYKAVEVVPEEGLFSFHERPNPACPVGKNIHVLLDNDLIAAQLALENFLKTKTVAQLLAHTKQHLKN